MPTPALGVLLVGEPPTGGTGGAFGVGGVVVVDPDVVAALGAAAPDAAVVKCGVNFCMSCGFGW